MGCVVLARARSQVSYSAWRVLAFGMLLTLGPVPLRASPPKHRVHSRSLAGAPPLPRSASVGIRDSQLVADDVQQGRKHSLSPLARSRPGTASLAMIDTQLLGSCLLADGVLG
ncbi:hypothetical protein F5144DRAFT_563362 [Chaetomium tenue]|uniref:Uncharacterized protein n=1 Tax=Chaetomium tenue TaxID=1854479 RepID=A0ACB7PKZ1_9PEZI|nr:hypothetical protein F5144DRAFT_563362 [Chaetomium globosum]